MKKILNIVDILLCFAFLHCIYAISASNSDSIHFLEPEDSVENDKSGLRIFCHSAKPKYLVHMWKTLIMNLHTNLESYELYDGKTPMEVKEKHEDNQRSWKFNLFGTKKNKRMRFSPFEDTCIGVYTYSYNQYQYRMSLAQLRIDMWKIAMMITGFVLFWFARRFSQNTLFYYVCSITLGVTTSVIILIYLISKLLPRGKVMYLMVATGWTMSFYLAQALWENAQLIMMQYREWVIWYIVVTSLISFIICYRFGPVTNTKTKKIIQWFLQCSGLVMIYYSSYFREASVLCCVLLLLVYNFPVVIIHKGKRCWKTMFPERRKLLTEGEYVVEGRRETKKALHNLQEYCSSPECNPWKTVLRLKNPIRFAKFMEGDSHLSDYEVEEHEAEITRIIEESEYTDDEDY